MDVVAQYIVLLWLLPVAPILLSLLLCFVWLFLVRLPLILLAPLLNLLKRILALFFRRYELRRTPRRKTRDLRAIIVDGTTTYSGQVSDVSSAGLCIRDIPTSFSTSRSLLSIIVQHGSTQQRLVARPRWLKQQRNRGMTIGAEIAIAPDQWQDFVLSW